MRLSFFCDFLCVKLRLNEVNHAVAMKNWVAQVKWHKKIEQELKGLDLSPPVAVAVGGGSEMLGLLQASVDWVDRVCLIVSDSQAAESTAAAIREVSGLLSKTEREVVMVPEVQGERRSWIPENEALRAAAMTRALARRPAVFVGSATAFLNSAPKPVEFARQRFALAPGEETFSPEKLAERLIELDYDNEVEVRVPGEFAKRGGIVDIFSPLYEYPVRIEYFGEEIESIRFFDPETQRSLKDCDCFEVVPRGLNILGSGEDSTSFLDYLTSYIPFMVWHPRVIEEHLARFADSEFQRKWAEFSDTYRQRIIEIAPPEEFSSGGDVALEWLPLDERAFFAAPEIGEETSLLHWQMLKANLLRWSSRGTAIVAACGNQGEAERFREMLETDSECGGVDVEIVPRRLQAGFYLPNINLVVLGDAEIVGTSSRSSAALEHSRYRADYRSNEERPLMEGDYAVHATQGIAIYHGIKEIEANGVLQEVMALEFADEARLYVPIEQSWLVSRYIGTARKPPKLSRIGGASWKKAREAAADSAYDLAAELIRVEAMRQNAKGFSFEEDPHWERPFAAAFPFSETPDQSRAIQEMLEDMARPEPMDRLLCGDVGYGKTEVAMRGAFRTVTNGRQVALLVPTTLLAQQHFYAFRQRMVEYPVNIEMISRFRSEAEQREILERTAEGRIDILIGTHRLLQSDVIFNDLGLIVIDEEQRFGVRAKEKLKQMRARVDILTMTATPIPRTLYFSLSGIRNLSTIMTPPAERLPVTTVVAQAEDDLIRRAVLRELERAGQVFFLHNRVRSIEVEYNRLQRIVPEARIAVAHGQMRGHELEEAMQAYLQGKVDVLVCTTIIESGLDIPNANTIIIQDADRFGLAELYQLRGRVGRYHHQAYAYLLLSPLGAPAKNARERLAAIRQYTRLGAGMNLALRDLEIRGAGNILGTRQSGHIAAVGFDFYCELLHEAVARLKKQPLPRGAKAVNVSLPGIQFGVVDGEDRGRGYPEPAGIPAWYVESEQLRLEYYRRLSKLTQEADRDELEDELKDRFGSLPRAVQTMLEIARLRLLAARRNIFSVSVRKRKILLETEEGLIKNKNNRLPLLEAEEPLSQLSEIIEYLRES